MTWTPPPAPPPTSLGIECPHCGAEPGRYCHRYLLHDATRTVPSCCWARIEAAGKLARPT